jgi:adenylate cyclase
MCRARRRWKAEEEAMTDGADTTRASDAWARNFEQHVRGTRWTRRVMRSLPHEPRCKFCFAPFAGAGSRVARLAGRRPSRKNPNLCDVCVEKGPPGGFETDAGVLFADVRGFTAFSESRPPSEVAARMNRFYASATAVLVDHEAVIDKLVGDEVMALFWPLLMDGDPCPTMVEAAKGLVRAVGREDGDGPGLPLGVGIDFGPLHIGNVGPEGMQDFTALGDVVNTAARLQGRAGPGEIVVSERVYGALDGTPAHPVELELKGKAEPVRAYVLEARLAA